MSCDLRLHILAILTVLAVITITGCGQKTDPAKETSQLQKTTETVIADEATGNNHFSPVHKFRKQPLIYVVDSYNPKTFGWTREINAGIAAGLREGGLIRDVNYKMVRDTLDAYVNSSPEKLAAQAERILNDIRSKKPDLVLTTDDDALVWVGLKLSDIPVVFNGVNGDPQKYLSSELIDSIEKPGHNITGVYQTAYFQQSLALLKKMVPTARTFGVLTDKTTTSTALLDALEKTDPQILPLKRHKTLVSDQLDQWMETLAAWQNQVDAVYLLSANAVKDEKGKLMSSEQTIAALSKHSSIPEVSCWAYQVQQGVLASAADDGGMQGERSAMLALKILQGANPGELPISTPPNGVPVLNLHRAKKLNISVPQDLTDLLIDQGMIFK